MLDKAAQVGSHTYAERAADCYETPTCAVEALLRVEQLPHAIWEPACGSGNIARVLEAAGHEVIATDLYDYGYGKPGIDFLNGRFVKISTAIVTNPPYQHAQKFVEKALTLSPLVVMLLRLAFLESERRRDILENAGLARIHVFRNRLPMLHRRGWTGPKASSAIPFCWMVWQRGYQGLPTLNRISWEK
jgi:hypothetical protein